QSEFGGAQHYVWEIARSLNPAIYDVAVAAGPEGDDELGLLAQLQKVGVRTIHLKNLRRAINPIFDVPAFFELKRLIEKEKPDVLFLNSTKAGILGSFAVRRKDADIKRKSAEQPPLNLPLIKGEKEKGLRIIYRIGGWVFNEDISAWQKKLYLFLEKFTAKRKDLIIVNSNIDRDIAVRLGIAGPEKIITIYNGLDWQSIKFLDQKEARMSLSLLTSSGIVKNQNTDWWVSRKIIGAVANLYKTKGLRYFIEAAAIVRKNYPEALFFIIGEGRERAELETLIIKNRLRDNFLLLGAAPSARIYLKAFDVFVLPSVKEGMPWAILEAMAAEVPIVATNVGGIPEM
ncbi:MAG: glycosyltransferase, partial [bacterium]|nr:glycosyltransferase [bacterium]